MRYGDAFDDEPDVFGDESDDYFDKLLAKRKQSHVNENKIPTNSNYGRDNGDIFKSMNYTKRKKKKSAVVKRHSSTGGSHRADRIKGTSSVGAYARRSRSSMSSGNIHRRKSKKQSVQGSTIVLSIFCIVLLICLIGSMAVNKLYTSKNVFTNNNINLDAIEERLVTTAENKERVTYFLIAGVDKSSMLTDCIWVMCFDNEAHKMNVLQIPRDTYVANDSVAPHKINAVYESPKTVKWCEKCDRAVDNSEISNSCHDVCGEKVTKKQESNINALIRCINNRLKLPIDHYVLFDFEGFTAVVDAIGGVDIYLENDLKVYPNKTDYVQLYAGENHLDGELALKFMRNRKAYIEGDLGRVRAQRQIIHAMMDKVTDMSILQMLSVLKAAYGKFSTDMSLEEIRSFIMPVKKCGSDSLNMFELPGESYWIKPNPSYYVCNKTQAAEVINEYMLPYSDKITADDLDFPMPY